MREFTKELAKIMAHVYVFIVKHKYACVTMGLLLFALSPIAVTGGKRILQVKAAKEIVFDDVIHMETVSEDYLEDWLYVMVDAGHGGKDPGANRGDLYEKDITLAVAKKVASLLERHKVKVIMTREDDTFVDKYDRARMANEQQVDLFISIHVNDLKYTGHSGIETYTGHMKRGGYLLSKAIHAQTVKATNANDLGVYTSNYVVVKYTTMPATLIEIGYISNEDERSKLQSQAYQQLLAEGIVAGILEYAEEEMNIKEP